MADNLEEEFKEFQEFKEDRRKNRYCNDENYLLLRDKPNQILNPGIWIPILFTCVASICGYIISSREDNIKSKYDTVKNTEDINEIKNTLKIIQKSISDNEKHMSSIEDFITEQYARHK